jgi:hypothetical protein
MACEKTWAENKSSTKSSRWLSFIDRFLALKIENNGNMPIPMQKGAICQVSENLHFCTQFIF